MIDLNPVRAEKVYDLRGAAIDGHSGYVMTLDEENVSYLLIAIPCQVKLAEFLKAELKGE